MSRPRVFVSFDTVHDGELYQLLLAQSRESISGFSVLGGSEEATVTKAWRKRVRESVRDADQVIVICGAHTQVSAGMLAELRITQEERTPYFLVWGRREIMCTKPAGAKPGEAMYSWTPRILEDQLALAARRAAANAAQARKD